MRKWGIMYTKSLINNCMPGEHAFDRSHAEWHRPKEQAKAPARHLEVVSSPLVEAPEASLEAAAGLAKVIDGMVKEIHGLRISEAGKLQEPLNTEITHEDSERMKEMQAIIDKFLIDKKISFPSELAVNPDYATVDDDGEAELARARKRVEEALKNG